MVLISFHACRFTADCQTVLELLEGCFEVLAECQYYVDALPGAGTVPNEFLACRCSFHANVN